MPFDDDMNEANKQMENYKKDMERKGRIADMAEEMYLLIKDLAGGSYAISEPSIIEDAKKFVKFIEGK